MAETSSVEALGAANDSVRATAKWIVTVGSGVGAVLLAGSQLSSIGKLDACRPTTLTCARLPLAVAAAVAGLAAVSYLVWRAAPLMLPLGITIEELEARWDDPVPRADVAFFKAHPAQLAYPRPGALVEARTRAWNDLWQARVALESATKQTQAARAQTVALYQTEFDRLDTTLAEVTAVAQHVVLKDRFERLRKQMLKATMAAALGILMFAWAANPPVPPEATADLRDTRLAGADLRDADLAGADLRGADFTGANLAGASLDGARLKDVVWRNTTCPDGTNSDDHSRTCLGHLSP